MCKCIATYLGIPWSKPKEMAAKAQTTQFSFLWDRYKLGKIKINLLLTVEVLFTVTRFKRPLHYYGKFPNYPLRKALTHQWLSLHWTRCEQRTPVLFHSKDSYIERLLLFTLWQLYCLERWKNLLIIDESWSSKLFILLTDRRQMTYKV